MKTRYLLLSISLILLWSCKSSIRREESENMNIWSYALKASSSHNAQPWEVVVRENKFILRSVEDRWLKEVDPENRELLLSFGAFIENLDQSSNALGYDLEIDFLLKSAFDRDIATIKFNKNSNPVDQVKLNVIESTYTEKGKYINKSLKQNQADSIKLIREENIHYINLEHNKFSWLKNALVDSNQQQAWRDNVQLELANYFCYNNQDKERGIGLTPEMLRFPAIFKSIWYIFYNKKSVMGKTFRDGAATNIKSQIANSAGFLIITSNSNSIMDTIEAGRIYQRVLIETRRENIEIHPVSQPLEELPWKDNINKELELSKPIQFILRTGVIKGKRVDYTIDSVTSASIRMPIDTFLADGKEK